jgi:hypothetical protein
MSRILMVRGSVETDRTEIVLLMRCPVRVTLKIYYFTPTPCHQFPLVIHQPDAGKKIWIDAYALRKPGQVCTQMRLAILSVANLNLGSFPAWQ